jgi:hypothetical protein
MAVVIKKIFKKREIEKGSLSKPKSYFVVSTPEKQ